MNISFPLYLSFYVPFHCFPTTPVNSVSFLFLSTTVLFSPTYFSYILFFLPFCLVLFFLTPLFAFLFLACLYSFITCFMLYSHNIFVPLLSFSYCSSSPHSFLLFSSPPLSSLFLLLFYPFTHLPHSLSSPHISSTLSSLP